MSRANVFRRLITSIQGGIAMEFALVAPVLLLFFAGMVEIMNLVVVQQKLQRTTSGISQALAQTTSVNNADLQALSYAMDQMMWPATGHTPVVITGVTWNSNPPAICAGVNAPCVAWQYIEGGIASRIGAPGSIANMPPGFTAANGQNYVIVEATTEYAPVMMGSSRLIPALASQTFYNVSIMKPRLGTLTTLR